ncbi:hypothetical protein N7533_004898 [Penicillium manginii]|uniref:uncharacterized protein n=1 Tax=Penicillium manginii TaxID=203109 RepID=UPI002548B6CC|nr:uncharacterized protein N7533_004898 [Penicillium manginii]KAJ5755355.1 hypothetical protein N7533_004898 [Penicillium manginii]
MPRTSFSSGGYVPSFARPTASSQARRDSTQTPTRQTDTPKLPFRTPFVPFHPSTSRPLSAMSENYSRRSSIALAHPGRASIYPSPAVSTRASISTSSASTHQPSSYRPLATRSIRSPTLTRKKLPRPPPQPQLRLNETELEKRLQVVAKNRFEEGLSQLNDDWQEEEEEKGRGQGKAPAKKISNPAPLAPGPISALHLKATAVPAVLSKIEVICDSHSHSSDSEESFHTALTTCSEESFHTARGSDSDGEAEKAFLNAREICMHWAVQLDRPVDERDDSVIGDIAGIGRE